MSDQKPLKARVTGVQLLNQDEKTLLDELITLQTSSLSNMRDAFRQLITLSSTIIGFQTTILGLVKYTFARPIAPEGLLVVVSFLAFFLSAALSVIGQLGSKLEISTLDTLAQYRAYRGKKLHNGYRWYMAASFFFLLGLASFLLSILLLLFRS